MKHIKLWMSAAATVGLLALQSASAQTISWSYDVYGFTQATGNNGGQPVPNTTAGVVPAINWNDVWNENGTAWPNPAVTVNNLWDSAGNNSGVSIAYHGSDIWQIQQNHTGIDGDGTYNRELLNGYVDSGSPNSSTIAISSIPYPAYSIIVYLSSDSAGRTGTVSVASTTYDFSTMGSSASSGANALFQKTTDTSGANPSADYAIFTNLSGAAQTIRSLVKNGGGIAGFQIVSNAESAVGIITQPPSSAAWRQNTANSLTVVASGAPIYYQWRTNSVDIPGATNATYSVASAALSDSATYTVLVYNDVNSVLSSNSVIIVYSDTNAPFISRIATYDGNTVWIQFNKLLNALTATNPANYSVVGAAVTNVVLSADGQSVTLYLSATVSSYATVTVNGVQDLIGNATSNVLGSAAVPNFQTITIGDATNLPASVAFDGNLINATGGGSDIYLGADNFCYFYYPTQFTGAFDFRMRVLSVPDAYGGAYTRLLLMARDANNLNSTNVQAAFVSPDLANGNNGGAGYIEVLYRRNNPVDNETNVQYDYAGPGAGSNTWLRLQRVDNSFNTYWSTNGTDWNFIMNIASNAASSAFPTNVLVGVAVCSHNVGATTTATVSDFGVTTVPVPNLKIGAAGANTVLNWGVDSPGYKVQKTTNLSSPIWVNVTNAQSAPTGQYQVTAPANSPTTFYRLIQQ